MTSSGTRWFGGVVALAAGCGGGSSGTGIPASTKLSTLTDAQLKALCDHIDAQQGGYNKTMTCADGPHMNYVDQAACVANLMTAGNGCVDLTAGDIEGCANGPMGNVCTFDTAPECANAKSCFNAG